VTLAWLAIAVSAAWVGFAYAGYPLVLWVLARLSPRPVRSGDVRAAVSVVIAVHDGGRALRRKLESTLALAAPGPLEVIVSSDGSSDDTDAVAESFAERGVRLVRTGARVGKEGAQARAIEKASGEILVFTDVTAELEPDALRELLRPFADPSVGCVSSEDRVDSEGGEGAYVRLEMALRRLESETSCLVGLSGSCFAIRRELASPWPADLASDFRSALEAARRGLRAVSAPAARAHFPAPDDPGREWGRKVRTVRRGLAVLSAYRDLLHPRAGRVALSLWGHKLARFTSPFALLLLLAASAGAAAGGSPLAAGLLAAQLGAIALGAAALGLPSVARLRPARILGYFLLVNASMLVAWGYHATGSRAVVWTPTRR
jgi:cellulose synthase/poly-beta-1,6-N-acetylglucosamine synthase-like glycosyltransferase